MKKAILTVSVLVLGVILVSVFMAGCIGTTADGQKDGRIVLMNAIKNSKSVVSSESSYETSFNVGGLIINMKTDIWDKVGKSRIDLTGKFFGMDLSAKLYKIGNDSYACTMSTGNWTCKQGEENISVTDVVRPFNFDEQEMLEMVTKKAIIIKPEVSEKKIAERTCDNVNIIINSTKLSELSPESDIAAATAQMSEGSSEVLMEQCLDRETGFPLYFRIEGNMTSPITGGIGAMVVEMTATKYIPNSEISDETFKLPVEVSE